MYRSLLGKVRLQALATAGVVALVFAMPASAQEEPPYKPGNYWSVTGIHVKDGSGLRYAQHLASSWSSNQEFAKSQGWISDYMVLSNPYPRDGEPDLYLIQIFANMPSADEADKRGKATREFNKTTLAQMQAESGGRVEIREVGSQMLLRQLVLRK